MSTSGKRVARCIKWAATGDPYYVVTIVIRGWIYTKRFYPEDYKGRPGALVAAVAWRDKRAGKYSCRKRYKAPLGVTYKNTLAYTIYKDWRYEYRNETWVARFNTASYERLERSFAVNKYGYNKARALAIAQRKAWEKKYGR